MNLACPKCKKGDAVLQPIQDNEQYHVHQPTWNEVDKMWEDVGLFPLDEYKCCDCGFTFYTEMEYEDE